MHRYTERMCIHICIYIYIYVYIYIYIYVSLSLSISLSLYIYIYIYLDVQILDAYILLKTSEIIGTPHVFQEELQKV